MNLIKCDRLNVLENKFYGGATGSKIAVEYNDRVWMLKCGESLKSKQFRNVEISYANDPITEYLGSHIYSILGFPVHDTLLGTYHGKNCVLCSDDIYPDRLIEFREFRNAIFDDGMIQQSSGMSTVLTDIMQVIDMSSRIPKVVAKERFWQMFVVDSFIGNTDRNNGNWGFIYRNGNFELYQIYDCGGCLNNKRSDQQMENDLVHNKVRELALNYTFNYKDADGRRINPLHYMKKYPNDTIVQTLALFTQERLQSIDQLVDSLIPIISEIRAQWYKEILYTRFEYLVDIREELTTR